MSNQSHLNVLKLRLSHEQSYLATATTDSERSLRAVWIKQVEKEIKSELEFLNLNETPQPEMSDDELLAALSE